MDISKYTSQLNTIRKKIYLIYKTLPPEKVLIISFLLMLSIIFSISAIIVFNKKFLITVPTYGGTINEGIVGTPRFINPVLANSDQDKDLTYLIFAGLTKKDKNGDIILDMAKNIEESSDGLKYIVTIKDNAYFHDDKKVTSDDVLYTISLVQNPIIKSPHKVEWEGVTLEKNSDKVLTFTLKKPFPLFMETLSLGILPRHIWKNLNEDQFSLSDINIKAVGSGPYYIKDIVSESGIPISFILKAHKKYTLDRPYINQIKIETFQNEKNLLKSFENKEITRIHGISPEKVSTLSIASSSVKTSLLPRTFAIFFNPNKLEPLAKKEIRKALELSIDKNKILNGVLNNYGKIINSPYPFDEEENIFEYDLEKAKKIISDSKILKSSSSTLEISLVTVNTEEMKKTAEMIKEDWSKIGIKVSISLYDISDLNQKIIKERDFQVLLFGAITQSPSDLYAFWHSSQRNYPGLNISNYVSKNLDENLEILRTSINKEERDVAYQAIKNEFKEETPGIFLFSPSLIYITNDKIKSELPLNSYNNSSRFTLIEKWYKYTDNIWPKTYYKPLLEIIENIIH